MTDRLRRLSDEELVEEYRRMKSELSGHDPRFRQVGDDPAGDPLRSEMERRGLAPDREDMIPGAETTSDYPGEEPGTLDRSGTG